MTSFEARKAFLDYFASRRHQVVPSSPLVLPDDPTLLFVNAGMNQFKDVFTGRQSPAYTRAASAQKCLRVSGKHNDLEQVGRTPRHHTFFEMLGNFSFGDYFKTEAIECAWELLTGVFGLPTERLWISVFGGSEAFEADTEARAIWVDRIGVPRERVLELGEKDNFWRMGETGPCGPCSEVYFDLAPESTEPSSPATDEARFVEIWNLVFMQYDQRADGLATLPAPSIDTGMGLERIVSVLQHKRSNYETDLFVPILDRAAERAGVRYGDDADNDFALRVIADHARAFCFLVADGVTPANDRRGYVLRRLLRRAIRYGRKLGIDEPFLHEVTPVVVEGLGPVYPELIAAQDAVLEIGGLEERRFADTLSTGLQMLEEQLGGLGEDGDQPPTLPGKDLFRLYDTFGFPLDLARDIADERGVRLDEQGFEREMAAQRARAQASWKGADRQEAEGAYRDLATEPPTRFVGYETLRLDDVPVLALLADGKPVSRLETGAEGEVLLEATPFYAESGGQIGDRGFLVGAEGRLAVLDTQRPAAGLIMHRVRVEAGQLSRDERVSAEVDEVRRLAIRRNHTATHLLHAALREVIGTHVKQAGSLVAPDRLRFDFTHFAAVQEHTLADVERLMNARVMDDLPITVTPMDLEEALRAGAMALFGEKYGESVRTVRMGEFSFELCGGTHTARTGELGLVKLTHERGIASGTRRVEAVSGEGSLERFRAEHTILRGLEDQLSVPGDQLGDELERRLDQVRQLQRELERQRLDNMRQRLAGKQPLEVAGVRLLAERVDGLGSQETRELADSLRGTLGSGVVVLGRGDEAKASLLVAVTPDLKGRLPAGDLVRELGRIIGGGGGGRPDMAEAGGREPGRLDEALAAAADVVRERLTAKGN